MLKICRMLDSRKPYVLPVHTLSVRGIPPDGCPALTLRPKLAARSIYVDAHVDLCPGDLRALTRKSD